MKKFSFSGILMLLSFHLAISQSGTILPTQADFLNNSTASNVYAVKGTITSAAPGGFSSAVRGQNNGTGGLGIGVWGSQAGSGWGVYGTAVGGIGVNGLATSGFGLYGSSTSGTGIYGSSTSGTAATFSVSTGSNNAVEITHSQLGVGLNVVLSSPSNGSRGINVQQTGVGPGVFATSAGGTGLWGITSSISAAGVLGDNTFGEAVVGRNRGGNGVGAVVGRNDSTGYGVRGFNTKAGIGVLGQAGISGGTGTGGRFENVNASSPGNALETSTNGTGAGGYLRNTNSSGNGAGLIVQKSNPFNTNYTTSPNADLEVRHPALLSSSAFGMVGLRIYNTGANANSWTFYSDNSTGSLRLFFKDTERGQFSSTTGAYTAFSDERLKRNIRKYTSTLDNLMKIQVKSYLMKGSDKTEVGLMAQEVMNYFPELVYKNASDGGEQFYMMDYSRIGVLAVKAVQEQQVIIQKQQTEINTLKAEMAALKKLVNDSLKK